MLLERRRSIQVSQLTTEKHVTLLERRSSIQVSQLTTEKREVPVEEQPSSWQFINNNVVVRAPHNRYRKRVYNKKHYCLYCSKPYAKMARHLENVH